MHDIYQDAVEESSIAMPHGGAGYQKNKVVGADAALPSSNLNLEPLIEPLNLVIISYFVLFNKQLFFYKHIVLFI